VLAGLNSNWWPAAASLAAALLALRAGLAERSRLAAGSTCDLLPAFWYATSAVLGVMAYAHAGDIGTLIADFGRRSSRSEGWYESRRAIQVVAVGVVATTWASLTFAAVLRFPERRRRYLPMLLVILSLMCFVAIRLVSLHHIDTVLYRTTVDGARIGVLIELAGLVFAAAMTFWQPRQRNCQISPSPRGQSKPSNSGQCGW
jgi:hypothetical protein